MGTDTPVLVDISGLTISEAFAALYNAAHTQGMGKMQYDELHHMDDVEANLVLLASPYVDYYRGRVIKVAFRDGAKQLDCTLYDRDNGEGAAQEAIERCRDIKEGYGTKFMYIPRVYMCCDAKRLEHQYGFSYDILEGWLSVFVDNSFGGRDQVVFRFETLPKSHPCERATAQAAVYGVHDYEEFNTHAMRVIYLVIRSLGEKRCTSGACRYLRRKRDVMPEFVSAPEII